MNLKVLPNSPDEKPWYADGLEFTCQTCGNCCTGGPGYVWMTPEEVAKLAIHLNLSVDETMEKHCRIIGKRVSLNEIRNAAGEYDCVFLVDKKIKGPDGVMQTKRVCGVYPVRPLQCRTWPFWDGNLKSEKAWDHAAERCHGMAVGGRKFTLEQIEQIRTAAEWPKRPPTSKEPKAK
ncbi:YkgJ family cysteine cluster protein [soil metagenome]